GAGPVAGRQPGRSPRRVAARGAQQRRARRRGSLAPGFGDGRAEAVRAEQAAGGARPDRRAAAGRLGSPAQRARQSRQQADGSAPGPARLDGELPRMSRLDGADGLRPAGPRSGLRAAGPRREPRGGGGRRPGGGDEPAMNSELVSKIVTLFHGGASVRRIALSLSVSGRPVHRARGQVGRGRATGPAGRAPRPAARASKLDAYAPAIADLLERYPDISVRRILEELRPLGYTGGYTILSERVLHLRPSPAVAPVRRFETGPGVQAQMDFSTYDLDFSDEGRRRVHAFSYVLGYSRR